MTDVEEQEPTQEPKLGWSEALGEHASNPAIPKEMGVGTVVEEDGTTWKLSSCENRIKAQFEQWVRGNAEAAIAGLEDSNPEMYREWMGAYLEARAAGSYNWEGTACRKALRDMPGVKHLIYLLIKRCHPKITEAKVSELMRKCGAQCTAAVRWAMGNSQSPAANGQPGMVKKEPPTLDQD